MVTNQSNNFQKVGECLSRNNHGAYFAWFSVNGKQIKKSLKTFDRELARRRLAELRVNARRIHGGGTEHMFVTTDNNLKYQQNLSGKKNSDCCFAFHKLAADSGQGGGNCNLYQRNADWGIR